MAIPEVCCLDVTFEAPLVVQHHDVVHPQVSQHNAAIMPHTMKPVKHTWLSHAAIANDPNEAAPCDVTASRGLHCYRSNSNMWSDHVPVKQGVKHPAARAQCSILLLLLLPLPLLPVSLPVHKPTLLITCHAMCT
jgi:hypothetical protein